MKKTFGILLIIGFTIFSCSKSTSNSDEKNDVSEYGFNGEVKSVKSQLFNLIAEKDTFRIGEKINGISFDRNSLLEFNKLGNLISSKEFLANGKVSDETIFTYDKNNRLIKKKEIDNYGKGFFYEYEFQYNSKDSINEWTISNDDFKRTHKIERNENNRPIKSEVIQNDTIFNTYNVKYDQNNNVISENQFKYKDIPVKLLERTFNKQNLKEKEQVVEYKTWDTLNYENRFVYDTNQKLILEKYNIESDSIFTEIKNTYHKNGNLKESITTPKGSFYFVIMTQKFNENGDLIEHSRLPSDDKPKEVWNYNFKYDSENNWIEKTEFKDNKPLRIVKRRIEYYK
jgi:ribosomal protein L3